MVAFFRAGTSTAAAVAAIELICIATRLLTTVMAAAAGSGELLSGI